jgi:hypothetical protein
VELHLHSTIRIHGVMFDQREEQIAVNRLLVCPQTLRSKYGISWDMTQCSPVQVHRRFGMTYYLHLQERKLNSRKQALLFDSEDGGNTLLRNAGSPVPGRYLAQRPLTRCDCAARGMYSVLYTVNTFRHHL